jgi:hypothetical protein
MAMALGGRVFREHRHEMVYVLEVDHGFGESVASSLLILMRGFERERA